METPARAKAQGFLASPGRPQDAQGEEGLGGKAGLEPVWKALDASLQARACPVLTENLQKFLSSGDSK